MSAEPLNGLFGLLSRAGRESSGKHERHSGKGGLTGCCLLITYDHPVLTHLSDHIEIVFLIEKGSDRLGDAGPDPVNPLELGGFRGIKLFKAADPLREEFRHMITDIPDPQTA